MTRSALAGWIAVISALPLSLSAQDADVDWIAQEEFQAGQIPVNFGNDQSYQGYIRAAILIAAPAERVWAILEDCENAPEYVPNVLTCELVETLEQQNAQIFRQRIRPRWYLPSFEHEFRLDYQPYTRIDVNRVSGPLGKLEGVWRLLPATRGDTILTYSLNFEPGLPVPRFIVGRILGHDLPVILAAVRDRAEATRSSGP
jgi:ribosome-associated toxin RatA of RatAB toxin-antitoxin module